MSCLFGVKPKSVTRGHVRTGSAHILYDWGRKKHYFSMFSDNRNDKPQTIEYGINHTMTQDNSPLLQTTDAQNTPHWPVMLEEILDVVKPAQGKSIMDGTFGAGGYSTAFLKAGAEVIAFDRDITVKQYLEPLSQRYKNRIHFYNRPFSQAPDVIAPHTLDACVFDVGVSSMQIDQSERGFSFMHDGPLDMRMDAGAGLTAREIVNTCTEETLSDIFYHFGEEKYARKIAKAIALKRHEQPLTSTHELAELVKATRPKSARDHKHHPATKTFQALRIVVNDELGQLEEALYNAQSLLKIGGVLAIVSFHSLEDRIVKEFLSAHSAKKVHTNKYRPVETPLNPGETFEVITKNPILCSQSEARMNPRSRSAKLRAAVRNNAPVSEQDIERAHVITEYKRAIERVYDECARTTDGGKR